MLDYCRQLATQGQVMMFRYTNVDGSKNNIVLQSCVEIQQVMNYYFKALFVVLRCLFLVAQKMLPLFVIEPIALDRSIC